MLRVAGGAIIWWSEGIKWTSRGFAIYPHRVACSQPQFYSPTNFDTVLHLSFTFIHSIFNITRVGRLKSVIIILFNLINSIYYNKDNNWSIVPSTKIAVRDAFARFDSDWMN